MKEAFIMLVVLQDREKDQRWPCFFNMIDLIEIKKAV